MQISTFVLLGGIEAFVLLLVMTIALLLYIVKLKRRARHVQTQTRRLLTDIKQLKKDFDEARIAFSTSSAYKQQINDQLLLTREHHKTLDAGRDIALDLDPEAPTNRQIAAFRHALLIAEKEALHNSADGSPNWQILEAKITQLIQFYSDTKTKVPAEQPAENQQQEIDELKNTLGEILKELGERSDEIASLENDLETANKRIGNLEKFKKLFFEMEDQWKDAKSEAQTYYERLMAMRDEVNDSESFDNLLNNYHNVYKEIETTIYTNASGDNKPEQSSIEIVPQEQPSPRDDASLSTTEIINSDKRALDELKKLRNLTADQHRLIAQLQKRLEEAETIEEKTAIIEELEKELNKQIGFVKESEICIQLLEDELSLAMQKTRELEEQLGTTREELDHIPKMQATIRQFTIESKEMLKGLAELENANEQLSQSNPSANVSDTSEKISELHKQLQNLQAQYADLEERYLEARVSE